MQPSQNDCDEPVDCGLGRQAAGCGEGVEAVARELVRCDIVPEVAGLCGVGQQVSDEVAELLLRSGDVLTSMQECREFGAVVLVGNERVGLEYSFEPLASVASLVPDFGKMFEVVGDLTFVPGDQDGFDAWEVLVERRTSDAGLLSDLRHRHRRQSVLGHQPCSGVQGRVAHGAAVRLDRLVPHLRHTSVYVTSMSRHSDLISTHCLVNWRRDVGNHPQERTRTWLTRPPTPTPTSTPATTRAWEPAADRPPARHAG